MRNTVIWSFLSLVAVATVGLVSGCDSDAKIARGSLGDSCTNTSECNDKLRCIDGACAKSAGSDNNNNEAGAGNGDAGAGSGVVPPTPPVLGGPGESCTKAADCEDGLGCFNNRCIAAPEGAGGDGNLPGVVLGKTGEICGTSSDCEKGLSCIPGGLLSPAPIGYVGICGKATGTFTPTGKSCGAECMAAADCCELPIELHTPYVALTAPYGTGAQSCSELTSLIGASDCTSAALTPAKKAQCFALAAYCDCAKGTWTCDAGSCNYAAKCTVEGAAPSGCPTYSRSGNALAGAGNCNTTSKKCEPDAVAVTGCKKDTDCDGGSTADTVENCADGECTCYKATGACYRKCNSTLDCEALYACDADTSVCVPEDQCSTNEECAIKMASTRYSCVDKTCQKNCVADYDCNSGTIDSTQSTVCVEGLCKEIGCSSDVQCTKLAGNQLVHMFCTTPEVVPGGTIVRSAITD